MQFGFAKEGAIVVIAYYNEHKDAEETKDFIERLGGTCLLLAGDIKDTKFCDKIVDETMKTNIYSMFYLTKRALKHMHPGSSIINVTSITTFQGEPELIDYVTSKGAIVGFTRSLATNLASKNIRVNAVSPRCILDSFATSLLGSRKNTYIRLRCTNGKGRSSL